MARPLVILLCLAALCCGGSWATTLVATAADPVKHDEAFIGALESLLAAAVAKEPYVTTGGGVQGHPQFAGAFARLAALKTHNQLTRVTKAGFLEPGFAALKAASTLDPVGQVMRKLYASFRSMPDPLLLGARNIKGGEYGEGPKGEAGGVDVGLSVARFGPCVFKGGAEVAGAYATGVRVAPTALDLGASGAALTPKLIDVSPELIDVHPKGADVSPAEINISPTLIQVAPGFTAARPGTVQDALISAVNGLAGSLGGGPGGGG